MSRPYLKIPKHPETVRMTEETSEKIKSIICRTAEWKFKLKDRSQVVGYAIEFLWKNINMIEKKMGG